MIRIHGAHNDAVCYTDALEENAAAQIRAVCDQPAFAGSRIRIMPDVHAGKGCTIGTTMTITDKVVPALVGVDIGCGMETVRLEQKELDFARLDALIRAEIPSGRNVRTVPHARAAGLNLPQLRCAAKIRQDRALCSIGTLGGGNHFIEVDRGADGALYLVIHSGSRHLGGEVAEYYQYAGWRALCGGTEARRRALVARYKAAGREQEIAAALLLMRGCSTAAVPRELAYVEGALLADYLHDMRLVQHFAAENRRAIADAILTGMGLARTDEFTTIHNYIDTEAGILRKGAVSAQKGERLLIPINMRDGSLLCTGRGNPDWNCSAPHGAGRLMSRSQACAALSIEEYRREMAGIYTTCVTSATLDESPMAYKSLDEIAAQLAPTAEITERLRPVYNFKAAE